jgi:hypothetical protein
VKAKLTTNSPTKRLYWRVIGDHSVTAEPRACASFKGSSPGTWSSAKTFPDLARVASTGCCRRARWC